MVAAKVAYDSYDGDSGDFQSITAPTAANDNRAPINQKQTPGSARLLAERQRRLQAVKNQTTEKAEKIIALQNRRQTASAAAQSLNALRAGRLKQTRTKKGNPVFRATQTVKAAGVAVEESIFYMFGYAAQIFAAASYALAAYISEESWWGYVLPVETIQYYSLGAMIAVAVIFTLKAVMAFSLSGTNFTRGAGGWTFPLCMLAGIPYLAFFPWILIWIWIVVWSQK